ncbi:unnamed protein product [Adineta steineri]|uniref:Uncharacterized protein n=1 Tax=Adineta steineri TaxID=433720 RepID=A0A815G2Y0_9BILA|nr:unnamed protein product [Adineta steineri]CAF3723255.1 unnamed protein product [Adineta steineri]
MQDYQLKSKQYMDKTGASKCLGTNDPLSDLVERTDKYLVNMRLLHRINQKQYEKLCVKPDEVELAHLYYLPNAHKPGTPLKPIIYGFKHPTIKISCFLDVLLRPLFDRMAVDTTVLSGSDLIN